jgi:acyl carrier protein
LEAENKQLRHVQAENQHLKQNIEAQVKDIIVKVTAGQAQDIARLRAQRDELWTRLKVAEAEAAQAEGRAQSESDKRLAVLIELQDALELGQAAEEMKEEIIANSAELEHLRKENAELKQERDQLELDIDSLNAKVAQLEELVASTRQKKSLQPDLAREDALRQSLDILMNMLSVVERQQNLQSKRRVVLPTEEEEKVHHARLVALGVYSF